MLYTLVCRFTKCTITNLHCGASPSAPLPIYTVALLQVHHSLISSVRLIKCDVHLSPLCAHYVHQSPVLSLYKVAIISTVVLLQLHRSTVNLHLLDNFLCNYAADRLCDYVIMLLVHSPLSTILLPM